MELKNAVIEIEEMLDELNRAPKLTPLEKMKDALKVAIPALKREVELEEQGFDGVLNALRRADRQDILEGLGKLRVAEVDSKRYVDLDEVIGVVDLKE